MADNNPFHKTWSERWRQWVMSNTSRHATVVAVTVVIILLIVAGVVIVGFSDPYMFLLRRQ